MYAFPVGLIAAITELIKSSPPSTLKYVFTEPESPFFVSWVAKFSADTKIGVLTPYCPPISLEPHFGHSSVKSSR